MVLIGTHDGAFHADDVLAVTMLLKVTQTHDMTPGELIPGLVRSRDPVLLSKCDYVVDVGGEYDHTTKRYDHHQRSFNKTWSDDTSIPLSSAGLVFLHYGKVLINGYVADMKHEPLDEEELDFAFNYIYSSFIKEIDAIDNGVKMCEETPPYTIMSGFSSRIQRCLPSWKEVWSPETLSIAFSRACTIAEAELSYHLKTAALDVVPARAVVKSACQNRLFDNQVIAFDACTPPWEEWIYEFEGDVPILYVIYPSGPGGAWRVKCVAKQFGVFGDRKPLPNEWCGKSDLDLVSACGVEGAQFVHKNGFIGSASSRKAIEEMVERALVL